MLTIIYKERLISLPYNPKSTLKELKSQVCHTLNLTNINLTHNNTLLKEDDTPLESLLQDESILHVEIVLKTSSVDLSQLGDMFPDLKKTFDENKQLKEILKNGNLEDEINKMNSNPDYMQTQLKNVDLAMSKLENMPGGLNMMSSMAKETEPINDFFKKKEKEYKLGGKNENTSLGVKRENFMLKYAIQIRELMEVGFNDLDRNVDVLKRCDGDVECAMLMLTEDE